MESEKPTLTVDEAAVLLSVSARTVKRLVAAGRLQPLDLGVRRLVFSRREIERFAAGVAPSAHDGIQQVS